MLHFWKEAIPFEKRFRDAAQVNACSTAGTIRLSLLDSEMKERRWVGGGDGGVMKVESQRTGKGRNLVNERHALKAGVCHLFNRGNPPGLPQLV